MHQIEKVEESLMQNEKFHVHVIFEMELNHIIKPLRLITLFNSNIPH